MTLFLKQTFLCTLVVGKCKPSVKLNRPNEILNSKLIHSEIFVLKRFDS